MMEKKEYICLVDCLCFRSIFKLNKLRSQFNISEVWYCSTTKLFKFINPLSVFKKAFSLTFKQFNYELGAMFSKNNQNTFLQWQQSVSILSIDIMKKTTKDSFILSRLDHRHSKNKIQLFLTQKISDDLEVPVRLIVIASNYNNEKNSHDKLPILLLISDIPWLNYVNEHGLKKSIPVYSYFSIDNLPGAFLLLFKFFVELVLNAFICIFVSQKYKPENNQPHVAVPYINGIDYEKRNDIFWFSNSQIPPQKVLIYFKSTARPLTKEVEAQLKKIGFKYINLLATRNNSALFRKLNGKINIFPTFYFLRKTIYEGFELFKLFFRVLFKFDKIKLWQFNHIGMLINKIIHYESFFKKYNVKVHFSLLGIGTDLAAFNLAIEQVGGIDISTHWSNFTTIHIMHSLFHDVYFCWGPFFKDVFKTMPCLTNHLIYSGYIYDSAFKEGKDRAMEHRNELIENGANFILTFFDEQYSKDGWFERSILEKCYLYLLSEVVNDRRLGLIIKTKKKKKESSLFQIKHPQIESLLESAIQSGRCLLFDDGRFPNEAAQASDLVIGVMVFNTAVFEAALSGIPFITLDVNGATFHPYYRFGLNKIVVNEFEDLKTAVNEFRTSRDSSFFVNSVEYLNCLKQIDPFQDRKASQRVGCFIKSVLDEFDKGATRLEAKESAIRKYQTQWGVDKVVNFDEKKFNFELATEAF